MAKYIELIDKYRVYQDDVGYNPPSYRWVDNTGEIVRCRECKYWSEVDTSDGLRYGECDRPDSAIRGNCFIRESWFCADGEREVQE